MCQNEHLLLRDHPSVHSDLDLWVILESLWLIESQVIWS